MELNKIYQGDCLEVLKTFPNESIDCAVTSPPYWALRDYGVDGQLGLEPTYQEYINKLCNIFDEIKRVLRKEGTCFINIGDTYGGTGDKKDYKDPKYPEGRNGQVKFLNKKNIPKCLCQIPSIFAIEMTNRGWILRNEIIWFKPNAMPSSAKDRFTVDYEKVFFFTKNTKYYFNTLYEPYKNSSEVRYRQALRNNKSYNSKEPYKNNLPYSNYKRGQGSVKSRGNDVDGLVVGGFNPKGRNKRCVWEIPTKPFLGAHFATFPEALIEPCIKSGCPEEGIVLDPFIGAGTTGVVAKRQKKNYIGIELNPDYIKIAEDRINNIK